MAGKFTIGEGLSAGFAMVGKGWRRVGLALALMAVSYTVLNAAQQDKTMESAGLIIVIGYVFYMVFCLMSTGALLRLSPILSPHLKADEVGPGGVQWRVLEWRLLGLTLLMTVLMILVIVVMGVVFVGIFAASGLALTDLASMNDPAAMEALLAAKPGLLGAMMGALLGLLVLYILCIWVAIRLSLAVPATAAAGSLQLFQTWKLTKGQFWRLFGGMIVVVLPIVVVAIFTSVLIGKGSVPGGVAASSSTIWGLSGLMALIAAFSVQPVQTGFLAEAYRKLSESPQDAF